MNNNNWINFDDGHSIGQLGPDRGKIVRDEENTSGARITLEQVGETAPFSITMGIYGVMFHTEFFGTLDRAQKCFDVYKSKIGQIIEHYEVIKSNRDDAWAIRHDRLMNELLTCADK